MESLIFGGNLENLSLEINILDIGLQCIIDFHMKKIKSVFTG